MRTSKIRFFLGLCWFFICFFCVPPVSAQNQAAPSADSTQVLQGFHEIEEERRQANELTTQEKHQIMFIMGVGLLVLLLLTAYFGIATGVMGKPLFLPHMVCAGLSVTLAIAHSVVAIVWFYPFK